MASYIYSPCGFMFSGEREGPLRVCVFRMKVENALDPRVKPEDDHLLLLFILLAGLQQESRQNDNFFNVTVNEPIL
jgi:hypothetical protein